MKLLIAGLLACGCVSLVDAPLWPAAGDYVDVASTCGSYGNAANCETMRKAWPADFADAIAGKKKAQEIVARCLSTGCDGAIKIDAVLGCAWHKVASATADGGADRETEGIEDYCGSRYLDETGTRAADAQAKILQQMLSVE